MRERITSLRGGSARGVAAGGALLFISSTLVNAGNYLFNLIMGRWLGPAEFADLSLIVTLLLVFSFITTTVAMVSAKFTAIEAARRDRAGIAGIRRWLAVRAWLAGLLMLAACTLGSPLLQRFFQTASPMPFVLLGIGMPFFFGQGVDRGVLQGETRFGLLALSYQAEMWVRLLAGVILVAHGFQVNGAVAAILLSFLATWLVARRAGVGLPSAGMPGPAQRAAMAAFAGPVIASLSAQILVNNSDVLIVKHFFPGPDAGHYAALALTGRMVFFATWSVVAVLFPIVAQRQAMGEPHRHLLWGAIGLVIAVSAAIVVVLLVAPTFVVDLLFGPEYRQIAPLLWLYGIATTLYAIANIVVTYELSAGVTGGSWIALGAGIIQVGALWLVHDSLRQVVLIQIGVMGGLMAALLLWSALVPRPEDTICRA